MYKKCFFFWVLFSCLQVISQEIQVIGNDSGFPLEGVSVSLPNGKVVGQTNDDGFFSLKPFENQSYFLLSHYKYIEKKIFSNSIEGKVVIVLNKLTEKLDEIVLSVSVEAEKKQRIAEQFKVFTKKEIQEISPQTTADLLSNSPGVKVQKSQFGGGSPVLRGMESNRVLLVVDGVRMNNAIYRKGHLQNSITVAPQMLDRVEVLFGPTSIKYGSDALGGVIHYYTKELETSYLSKSQGSVFSRYSTVNNEFTSHFDVEVSHYKWASYTSVSYSDFGDLKMGKNRNHGYNDWGKVFEYSLNDKDSYFEFPTTNKNPAVQKNTGYSQFDLLQKLFLPLSKKTDLILNFQLSESSTIPRFDNLTQLDSQGDLKFAEWSYGPQKRILLSSQLKFDHINPWVDKGAITFAFQDISESRTQRKFGELMRYNRFENVDVFSVNGDFSVALSPVKNKVLSYGFEAVYNNVNSTSLGEKLNVNSLSNKVTGIASNFSVPTRYPDGGSSYFTQALYSGYRQDLNSEQTLNTGLRFTTTQLRATWVDESFISLPEKEVSLMNAALTATIGHVYKPSNSTKISTVISSGFRSPNIDDIGKIREKNGNVTVPNADLKPEHAYSIDFGVLQYANEKAFSFGLNAYYTLLKNYITRADYALPNFSNPIYDGEQVNVMANINRGNAYVYGSTFSLQGEFSNHWYTNGSITYTKGRTYDTNQPLSSIPPLFGSLMLGYHLNKLKVQIGVDFNGKKSKSDYNFEEGIDNIEQTPLLNLNATEVSEKYAGTPAWHIFNFFTSYGFNSNVDFQFQIDNIFDIHYKEFASGINAPGRNISTSIRYYF